MHEIVADYADFTKDELNGLREDLRQHGLRDPITLWNGLVVDGRHRLKICTELRIEPRFDDVTKKFPTEEAMRAYVKSKNQHRRSRTVPMSNEEKHARVEAALKANPLRSNQLIADDLGLSRHIVANARSKLEAVGAVTKTNSAERIAKSGQVGGGLKLDPRKHAQIKAATKRHPLRSGRSIAAEFGVHHSTVDAMKRSPANSRSAPDAWRDGLTADEQCTIMRISRPEHRAQLDDVPLAVRKVVAANLVNYSVTEAYTRKEQQDKSKHKSVPVFNPRWYSMRIDAQTARMLVIHRAEKRYDLLEAAAKANDCDRYGVVSQMLTSQKAKTMREKYPHLFDRDDAPSILHEHLGTIDDEETKALRDFATILVNVIESGGGDPASVRTQLHRICACIRHCTDARSWDERLWALGDAISLRDPSSRLNVSSVHQSCAG
jgi:DNA-binding MarR family transcriptional regulator